MKERGGQLIKRREDGCMRTNAKRQVALGRELTKTLLIVFIFLSGIGSKVS